MGAEIEWRLFRMNVSIEFEEEELWLLYHMVNFYRMYLKRDYTYNWEETAKMVHQKEIVLSNQIYEKIPLMSNGKVINGIQIKKRGEQDAKH